MQETEIAEVHINQPKQTCLNLIYKLNAFVHPRQCFIPVITSDFVQSVH